LVGVGVGGLIIFGVWSLIYETAVG